MIKLNNYQQCDSRWAQIDYSAKGERTNICESGCGPTSMAIILSFFLKREVLPTETCSWALRNGYKAPKQGTYYSFFEACAKAYGLEGKQLNRINLRKNPNEKIHSDVLAALMQGDLIVACMGPSNWTKRGHYIVLYNIDVKRDIAYVSDPASTKENRVRGSWELLKKEVKYYFIIRKGGQKEMSEKTNNTKEPSSWAKEAWEKATEKKIFDGTNPKGNITREQVAVVLDRLGLIK